jgi:hypothetical protein
MKNTGGFIALAALGGILLATGDKSSAGSSQVSSTASDPNSTAARLKAINDYEVKTGLPPDYLYPYAINSGYALGSVWYNLETGAPGAFVVPNTSPGSKGNLLQPISEWNNYYPGVNIPRRP